jgi:hypothetical protein
MSIEQEICEDFPKIDFFYRISYNVRQDASALLIENLRNIFK